MSKQKVLDVHWFLATNDAVGLIIAEDTVTGKINGYIGFCQKTLGLLQSSESGDIEYIIKWGCKIKYPDIVKGYIESLRKINKVEE